MWTRGVGETYNVAQPWEQQFDILYIDFHWCLPLNEGISNVKCTVYHFNRVYSDHTCAKQQTFCFLVVELRTDCCLFDKLELDNFPGPSYWCRNSPLRAGTMAWISKYNFVLTIHLSLIRQDNLPPSARRIDGQGLLEALLNLRAPHSLGIIVCRLVCRVAHPLHVLGRTFAAAPAAGINRGGWALQAGAWSRQGRNLEFPNTQGSKLLLSTTELGTFGSKTHSQCTVLARCSIWPNKLGHCQKYCGFRRNG